MLPQPLHDRGDSQDAGRVVAVDTSHPHADRAGAGALHDIYHVRVRILEWDHALFRPWTIFFTVTQLLLEQLPGNTQVIMFTNHPDKTAILDHGQATDVVLAHN